MSCAEASVELVRKCQRDVVVLAGCKVPEIPVPILEYEAMSLSEAMLQMRCFSGTMYPAVFKESLAAVPEEAPIIDVPAGDLDGRADLDLPNLTEGSDSGIQAFFLGDYWRLREACSVACDFGTASVAIGDVN